MPLAIFPGTPGSDPRAAGSQGDSLMPHCPQHTSGYIGRLGTATCSATSPGPCTRWPWSPSPPVSPRASHPSQEVSLRCHAMRQGLGLSLWSPLLVLLMCPGPVGAGEVGSSHPSQAEDRGAGKTRGPGEGAAADSWVPVCPVCCGLRWEG